jgi:hypothetical protein
MSSEKETIDPRYTERFAEKIREVFEPCNLEDDEEEKTTLDIKHEFESFTNTDLDTINDAMEKVGFKAVYYGGGLVWPMRRIK